VRRVRGPPSGSVPASEASLKKHPQGDARRNWASEASRENLGYWPKNYPRIPVLV